MQNLKQKLADQGLSGTLVLRENGAQIPLRFSKGETRKWGKLTLGSATMEVEFVLEEVPGAAAEHPNLRLTIQSGPPPKIELKDTLAVQTAAVEAAAKKEAEAAAAAKAAVTADAEDKPAATTTNTSSGDKDKTTAAPSNPNKGQPIGGAKKGN